MNGKTLISFLKDNLEHKDNFSKFGVCGSNSNEIQPPCPICKFDLIKWLNKAEGTFAMYWPDFRTQEDEGYDYLIRIYTCRPRQNTQISIQDNKSRFLSAIKMQLDKKKMEMIETKDKYRTYRFIDHTSQSSSSNTTDIVQLAMSSSNIPAMQPTAVSSNTILPAQPSTVQPPQRPTILSNAFLTNQTNSINSAGNFSLVQTSPTTVLTFQTSNVPTSPTSNVQTVIALQNGNMPTSPTSNVPTVIALQNVQLISPTGEAIFLQPSPPPHFAVQNAQTTQISKSPANPLTPEGDMFDYSQLVLPGESSVESTSSHEITNNIAHSSNLKRRRKSSIDSFENINQESPFNEEFLNSNLLAENNLNEMIGSPVGNDLHQIPDRSTLTFPSINSLQLQTIKQIIDPVEDVELILIPTDTIIAKLRFMGVQILKKTFTGSFKVGSCKQQETFGSHENFFQLPSSYDECVMLREQKNTPIDCFYQKDEETVNGILEGFAAPIEVIWEKCDDAPNDFPGNYALRLIVRKYNRLKICFNNFQTDVGRIRRNGIYVVFDYPSFLLNCIQKNTSPDILINLSAGDRDPRRSCYLLLELTVSLAERLNKRNEGVSLSDTLSGMTL